MKARIVAIKLIEKIKHLPGYAESIGLSADDLKGTDDGKQQNKHER